MRQPYRHNALAPDLHKAPGLTPLTPKKKGSANVNLHWAGGEELESAFIAEGPIRYGLARQHDDCPHGPGFVMTIPIPPRLCQAMEIAPDARAAIVLHDIDNMAEMITALNFMANRAFGRVSMIGALDRARAGLRDVTGEPVD